MDTQLTWDDVLKNEALIGGDIESQEDGVVYRGPLSELKADDNEIHFTSPWTARLNPSTAKWEKWHLDTFWVTKEFPPQDIGDGRILFRMPFLGHCTIFPKGGSKLDTCKVEGLPADSERFLALYPDLGFDREIVLKVLVDKAFVQSHETFLKKPADATLQDLLECFVHDSSREEFLWHYVETVTGEKEVYRKVY